MPERRSQTLQPTQRPRDSLLGVLLQELGKRLLWLGGEWPPNRLSHLPQPQVHVVRRTFRA